MTTADEILALLRVVAGDVAIIKAKLASGGVNGAAPRSNGASSGPAVASDRDLDSSYGDPLVKNDPKRWDGQSYKGFHFSETEPDYLDCVAEFKEWSAGKDDETGAKDARGQPKSKWAKLDAQRARGWAARLRVGWKPAGAPPDRGGEDTHGSNGSGGYCSGDDDIPF